MPVVIPSWLGLGIYGPMGIPVWPLAAVHCNLV